MCILSQTRLAPAQLVSVLLPRISSSGLKIDGIEQEQESHVISVTLRLTATTARCPKCNTIAKRVHGHYTRTLADLPWGSFLVRLHLRVRKFFCRFSGCIRAIFAERMPALVTPYAQRTLRQVEIVRLL